MKKIFLSPERRPAPHGKYWGVDAYEHEVCCEIAETVKSYLSFNGFNVFLANPEDTIYTRADWANNNGMDLYVCIHTNASTNGTVEGTAQGPEMLAFQHPEAIKANQCIYDEIMKIYPRKTNRGLKNGNAYTENASTVMVSAYAEIAFHDNGEDAKWIVNNKDSIAEAIAKGICDYYSVEYKKYSPDSSSITIDDLVKLLSQNGISTITL